MMLLGKVDYIYELRKEILNYYGKEISRSLYLALARLIVASTSAKEKEKLNVEYKRVLKAYDKMKDKTSYIYRVSEEKKKLAIEIEQKDIILNDRNALHKEFERRNKDLPEDKKIFNVSDLSERLRVEREKCVKRIRELNEMVKPANYSGLKNELVEKIQIMSVVDEDKTIDDYAIEYNKEVIKCFSKIIEKINSKEEIIDIIYKIRYYRKLRITENKKVEDIQELFSPIDKLLKFVVTKACREKVFNIFCQDIELNYNIISVALDTAISNYEDVDISLNIIDKNIIEVTVYDNEVVDKREEIDFIVNTKDLNFKLNKRIPMYVF
ncbi:MAG: hypothetical protein HFJ25_02415 [Clostridia bacterium]|nr:hypothetical protein [Clostridia bacterium]